MKVAALPALAHVLVVVLLVLLGGCADDSSGGQDSTPSQDGSAQGSVADADDGDSIDCSDTAGAEFPDVVDVSLDPASDGTYTVAATLCSAYDTPDRYADAWRVSTPEGEVLAVRELLHDHANEQPFTRSLNDPIDIPEGVDTLVVEGRDLANGWGGAAVEVDVPDTG